ncbi:hypothetical protein IW261DRAFT_1596065, partial [Armillaria novae-zelandiae]
MYTNESFRLKTTRKYGKTLRKIVRRSQDSEPVQCQGTRGVQDGCYQSVCLHAFFFLGRLMMVYLEARLERSKDSVWPGCMGECNGESIVRETAWSVVLSGKNENFDKDKGNKIKDGTMQVKDQEYTCGNKALQNAMRSGEAIHIIRGYKLDSAYPKEWVPLRRLVDCDRVLRDNGWKWIQHHFIQARAAKTAFYSPAIMPELSHSVFLVSSSSQPYGVFWAYPEAEASSCALLFNFSKFPSTDRTPLVI